MLVLVLFIVVFPLVLLLLPFGNLLLCLKESSILVAIPAQRPHLLRDLLVHLHLELGQHASLIHSVVSESAVESSRSGSRFLLLLLVIVEFWSLRNLWSWFSQAGFCPPSMSEITYFRFKLGFSTTGRSHFFLVFDSTG